MVEETVEKETKKELKEKVKLEKKQKKEEKQLNKAEKKEKKLPKEISQEILKKMFRNLLKAIGIMAYFAILNLAYVSMKQERLVGDIKVFAGAFLIAGLVTLEKAYKKDKGSMGISGIELLLLSLHSLSIMHVITLLKYDFRIYLLTSSYVFSIYYVLKSIFLYTKGRRDYLNSFSDIAEIVKKEEPIKKEAKKRKTEEVKEEVKEEKIEKTTKKKKEVAEAIKSTTTKKKTTKTKTTKKEQPKTKKTLKKEEKEND